MKTKKRLIKNCTYTWEVVEILARMIRKYPQYHDCEVETYGPFGLTCESSVYVERNGEIIGDLCVVYGGDGKLARRTYEKVNNYPVGSIAELNGMNYKIRELPLDNQQCLDLVFAKTEE